MDVIVEMLISKQASCHRKAYNQHNPASRGGAVCEKTVCQQKTQHISIQTASILQESDTKFPADEYNAAGSRYEM